MTSQFPPGVPATIDSAVDVAEEACSSPTGAAAAAAWFGDNPHFAAVGLFAKSAADFQYERAKELADKERDAIRSSSPKWSGLHAILGQLALAERHYMGLAFLLPKGFMRKENSLKTQFDGLRQELQKLRSSVGNSSHKGQERGKGEDLMSVADQLGRFVHARNRLMEFYEASFNMGSNSVAMDFDRLLNTLMDISNDFENSIQHPCLEPLRNLLSQECNILKGFIGALISISHWKFSESLIDMISASQLLRTWEGLVQDSKDLRKASFMTSTLFGSQPDPLLFQWFSKLKNCVMSKYSLYFESILAKQATEAMHQANRAKLVTDYVSKIQNFQRRYDAFNVSIVFDATKEPDYKGPGFQFSSTEIPQLHGLDLFPCIFSCPGEQPSSHWPSLIMMLNENEKALDGFDKAVNFRDDQAGMSYVLHRLDPQMTLVAIFESKKFDNDQSVIAFMKELGLQLRCTKVFISLKPGTK